MLMYSEISYCLLHTKHGKRVDIKTNVCMQTQVKKKIKVENYVKIYNRGKKYVFIKKS